MFRWLLAVFVLNVASERCLAEDSASVLGAGQETCGSYIAASAGDALGVGKSAKWPDGQTFFGMEHLYQQWLAGFLSSANELRGITGKPDIKVDFPGLDLWVRNWCNAHPLETVNSAAVTLLRERYGTPQ